MKKLSHKNKTPANAGVHNNLKIWSKNYITSMASP
jgi:hypothetical protein